MIINVDFLILSNTIFSQLFLLFLGTTKVQDIDICREAFVKHLQCNNNSEVECLGLYSQNVLNKASKFCKMIGPIQYISYTNYYQCLLFSLHVALLVLIFCCSHQHKVKESLSIRTMKRNETVRSCKFLLTLHYFPSMTVISP